jgi:hypothetical protein
MRRAPLVALCLAACGGQTASPGTGSSRDASAEAGPTTGDDGGSQSGDDGGPSTDTSFLTVLTSGSCLPQTLLDGASGVPCTVFEELPGGGCAASSGLSAVDPSVAATVRAHSGASATDTVCALDQIAVAPGRSCTTSAAPGWCYVTGAATGTCPQSIAFTPGTPEPGAIVVLGCQ